MARLDSALDARFGDSPPRRQGGFRVCCGPGRAGGQVPRRLHYIGYDIDCSVIDCDMQIVIDYLVKRYRANEC